MYGSEREKEIMNILRQNHYVTVEYLAQKIHISPSSIRRDLKHLESEGMIIRSYGGAELKASANKKIPFFLRSHQNTKEKNHVAQKAASLVKPGDIIFTDSSTSTYFMFEYLKNIKDITVITNSLAGMNLCAEYNISAFSTGGRLNIENPTCFVGRHAEQAIGEFHADLCFFSAQSLTPDGVIYDCFEHEINLRKQMIQNAETKVFLCDNSKLDHFSAYRLCSANDIDYIICDIDIKAYLTNTYTHIRFAEDIDN